MSQGTANSLEIEHLGHSDVSISKYKLPKCQNPQAHNFQTSEFFIVM